jgi:hypothetical protein
MPAVLLQARGVLPVRLAVAPLVRRRAVRAAYGRVLAGAALLDVPSRPFAAPVRIGRDFERLRVVSPPQARGPGVLG